MPFADLVPFTRSIDADLAQLTPLYDFVLVREIRGVKPGRTSSIILDPGEINKTGDGRILHNRAKGLRLGEVVSVGRGDKKPFHFYYCRECLSSWTDENGRTKCPCGANREQAGPKLSHPHVRHSMHVKPGDKVLYPRIPANDVRINGQEYTFCREEQHILAVVEEE